MTNPTFPPALVETAARAIDAHGNAFPKRGCTCGWYERDEIRGDHAAWLEHQARAVLAAVAADLWAEGFQDGRRQDFEGDDGPVFTNPYTPEES